MPNLELSELTRSQKLEELALREEKNRRDRRRKIWTYFPDTGPLRRELYHKHLEFFRVGKNKRVRLALCANRVGKTETMGGYEVACHLTGQYPAWWEGRRFAKPIRVWAAGDTAKTTRDAIQEKMIGPWDDRGTGLILGDCLLNVSPKQGIANAAEIVSVKHVSGGSSTLMFKSFDQRREAFQGTEQDIIWLDEECPQDIYEESLTRTLTNNGMVILTFTPLLGLTPLIEGFLEGGSIQDPKNNGTKHVILASWDDAPHLDHQAKEDMLGEYQPYQRDARSKGIPQLGSGAIYPVSEDDYTVPDFPIPDHWPRWFAMDVGWNRTAAIHFAWDRDVDVIYEYYCHYRSEGEPSVHVHGIKAPGDWIPGVVDPAARGRSQVDGQQLIQMYRDLGLELSAANNSVESGIYSVWQRLSSGRLKTFKIACAPVVQERRLYRRDVKGHVVKEKDHAMDTERYGVVSGIEIGKTKPIKKANYTPYTGAGSWMG
jgi:phage terminase large subunit-like protein